MVPDLPAGMCVIGGLPQRRVARVVGGELGVPEADKEHDTGVRGQVENLVLKRVVEHKCATLLPPQRARAHAQLAPAAARGRHAQAQVRSQPQVARRAVRADVRARREYAQDHLARAALAQVDCSRCVRSEQSHRPRCELGARACPEQHRLAPGPRVDHAPVVLAHLSVDATHCVPRTLGRAPRALPLWQKRVKLELHLCALCLEEPQPAEVGRLPNTFRRSRERDKRARPLHDC
mmetsp:Transcript_43215/g.101467  ORF Transcript_43215/g.101467 Transcript_43215/m.101467 type:complete len:235 (+) Transcript_43215:152-856(+)